MTSSVPSEVVEMFQFFSYEYQWVAYIGSIAGSIIALIVLFLLAHRNREKQSKTIAALEGMVGFLALATIIDYSFFTINGLFPTIGVLFDFIMLGSYLSYTSSAIANIFLLIFLRVVFFDGKNKVFIKILTILEAAIGPALVALFFIDEEDLALLVLLIHVASALAIYMVQAVNAFKIRNSIKYDKAKRVEINGLTYIGISGIVLFAAITLFVSHEIIIQIPIREYWTVAFGWLLGSIAGVFVYIGYTPPKWLKKRWSAKGSNTEIRAYRTKDY